MGQANLGRVKVLWFNVTTSTSTAPLDSRIGDIVINGGTAACTVGGVSLPIGSFATISSIDPFILNSATVGNIRGATGATGSQASAAVSGVKGSAESAYRIGDVNITATNIGLGNVANERQYSASNKPTPADIGAEPAFTKNSAFNKNFGTATGTVWEDTDTV